MRRLSRVSIAAVATAFLLCPCGSHAASQSASATRKAATPTAAAVQPQAGGIYKVLLKSKSNGFGYPPRILGSDREFAPPFFDHLMIIGDDGKYHPQLALSWDASKDGKSITLKLRHGVTFHDGTLFNAQAVKENLDNLVPPKANILAGITSVDVVDDETVRLNLTSYNNLILYHLAANPLTYMYSPEALKKNGADWAMTHPVGTGPFVLKDYQPNISLTLVKNPHYWQKGLPYLDGIEMAMVPDPMTQMLTFKAGQAHAIYSPQEGAAAQLRDEGYPLKAAIGSLIGMNFDSKNSEIFSKRQIREAIEYAIDKEAICNGPGARLYTPMYQIVAPDSPDHHKACTPRRYNPAKAKQLLAAAGYPNGFGFKVFVLDSAWKDGWVAVQNYLDKVGVKMEISYVNVSAFNLIRSGKIEKGAAAYATLQTSANTLYTLDSYWLSSSTAYPYVVKPAGIDKLINQAKLSRDAAAVRKINQQVIKLIYDDETIIPFYMSPRMAIVDKSVQNTGWFIYGDPDNNLFGTATWLRKQ